MNNYAKLGLDSSASKEDVKKAYKKLAKKYHPDVNPDPAATEKYKEVTQAYEDIMSGKSYGRMDYDFNNIDEMFQDFFREQTVTHRQPIDLDVELNVTVNESIKGCVKTVISARTHEPVNVVIKPGTKNGDKIVLENEGLDGGRLIVEILTDVTSTVTINDEPVVLEDGGIVLNVPVEHFITGLPYKITSNLDGLNGLGVEFLPLTSDKFVTELAGLSFVVKPQLPRTEEELNRLREQLIKKD